MSSAKFWAYLTQAYYTLLWILWWLLEWLTALLEYLNLNMIGFWKPQKSLESPLVKQSWNHKWKTNFKGVKKYASIYLHNKRVTAIVAFILMFWYLFEENNNRLCFVIKHLYRKLFVPEKSKKSTAHLIKSSSFRGASKATNPTICTCW